MQKRDDGRVLAMKVMRKAHVVEKNQSEYMRTERDVLTRVEHPYIVLLHYSFQTATKLYLVLDFINGGHLFFQLYRAGIFEEPLARVYTAELVLALTHLHSLGIAHRGAPRSAWGWGCGVSTRRRLTRSAAAPPVCRLEAGEHPAGRGGAHPRDGLRAGQSHHGGQPQQLARRHHRLCAAIRACYTLRARRG